MTGTMMGTVLTTAKAVRDSAWGKWRSWAHGLIASFIGGGASAVSAGFSAGIVDPDHFGLTAMHHKDLFDLMGTTFVISGVLAASAYLKQSPLPNGK